MAGTFNLKGTHITLNQTDSGIRDVTYGDDQDADGYDKDVLQVSFRSWGISLYGSETLDREAVKHLSTMLTGWLEQTKDL